MKLARISAATTDATRARDSPFPAGAERFNFEQFLVTASSFNREHNCGRSLSAGRGGEAGGAGRGAPGGHGAGLGLPPRRSRVTTVCVGHGATTDLPVCGPADLAARGIAHIIQSWHGIAAATIMMKRFVVHDHEVTPSPSRLTATGLGDCHGSEN